MRAASEVAYADTDFSVTLASIKIAVSLTQLKKKLFCYREILSLDREGLSYPEDDQ